MSEDNNKNGDSKRLVIALVLVLAVMVTTTAGTYAYLSFAANAVNNVTGTVATASLSFSVAPTLESPTGTYANSPLVPQYAYNSSANTLQAAVTGVTPSGGSSVVPCVDANGNAVCRIYTFTLRNDSTSTAVISGKISFTNPTTNLKWAPMTSATTVATISSASDSDIHAASTSDVALTDGAGTTSWSIAPNGTKQFWVVFWINETGSAQADSGTWYATLRFDSSNGTGITSTITGA